MEEDVRIRFTRQSIDDAFVTLLQEKKLDAITVKELCAEAGVSRATFYRHYRDVRDLMDFIEGEILADLYDELRLRKRDLASIIDLALGSLKSGGHRYRVLFSSNGDPFFLEELFSAARETVDDEMAFCFPKVSPIEREWLFRYFSKGCAGVWTCWLERGMVEPVEEVARFTLGLIESSMGR